MRYFVAAVAMFVICESQKISEQCIVRKETEMQCRCVNNEVNNQKK